MQRKRSAVKVRLGIDRETCACICEGRVFDAASTAPTMFSNRQIFCSPGLAIGETRDDGMQVL